LLSGPFDRFRLLPDAFFLRQQYARQFLECDRLGYRAIFEHPDADKELVVCHGYRLLTRLGGFDRRVTPLPSEASDIGTMNCDSGHLVITLINPSLMSCPVDRLRLAAWFPEFITGSPC
jgi:hypothetical protein